METYRREGFRPLTGINFNVWRITSSRDSSSFRPLTGISFNIMKRAWIMAKSVSVPSRG